MAVAFPDLVHSGLNRPAQMFSFFEDLELVHRWRRTIRADRALHLAAVGRLVYNGPNETAWKVFTVAFG